MDIVIQGGDTGAAVRALRQAVQDIFGAQPIRSVIGNTPPGTRDFFMAATIALTLPITAVAVVDLVRLGHQLHDFLTKASEQQQITGARLMIDLGDGNLIPIEDADRQKINEALTALEARLKNARYG